jgi:hypothetical protein
MKSKLYFPGSFLTLLLITALPGWAKPVQPATAFQVAKAWLADNPRPMLVQKFGDSWKAKASRPFLDQSGNIVAHIIDLDPEGFIVVPADDTVEPIIAFSATGHFEGSLNSQDVLSDLLLKDIPDRIRTASMDTSLDSATAPIIQEHNLHVISAWSDLKQKAEAAQSGVQASGIHIMSAPSTINVSPMLADTWDQWDETNGNLPLTYNYYCPTGCPTGCVATAMGMIIHWFQYPASASGTNTIYVGNTQEQASFNDTYLYSTMPTYLVSTSQSSQIQAIARLLYDCGISVGMQYTSTGSGAYDNVIAPAYTGYFKYKSATWRAGTGSWGTTLQTELAAGYPAQFCIEGSGEGHSVVCDGYGSTSGSTYYHLNLGWGGYENDWYSVPGFSAGGITWSTLDGFVYNIRPSTATLTGNLILSYYVGNKTQVPITVGLRLHNATATTRTINISSAGAYTITNVPYGTYDLAFKASHWLKKVVTNVSVASSSVSVPSVTLTNGDVNGDNFVEDQDYSMMGAAWYSITGDSNYNVNADLNGDGAVEDQDYSIMGLAWYQQGDQ